MAYFDLNRTATQSPLGRLAAEIYGAFIAWRDARQIRRAMAKLTDRELEDLGLLQADLDDLRHVWR